SHLLATPQLQDIPRVIFSYYQLDLFEQPNFVLYLGAAAKSPKMMQTPLPAETTDPVPARSQCKAMLEELDKLASVNPIRLQDKHVMHLGLTAKALLDKHAGAQVIAVALPPLICWDRYHYAHVYVEDGMIEYRGATSINYPRNNGELRCRDAIEEGRYYKEEAIEYARHHWGHQLQTWTVRSHGGYQTDSMVEGLELSYSD
ncbi:uncharacterized protein PV07_12674, partial [Cladophialophora immunda]